MLEFANPIFADLYITHFCNLACGFCYYRAFRDKESRDLTTEDWLRVIDELAEMRVLRLSIPGGEPFVRGDILELLAHIAKNRMRMRLNTNGTLLDGRLADILAEIGHFDQIQISIDGMREQHDAVRGIGTWEKAVQAVRLLKERGLPVGINMVMTAENYPCCEEASRFFCEKLQVDMLRVTPVTDVFTPLNQGIGKLSAKQMAEIILTLDRLAKQYPALAKGGSAFLTMYREIQNPKSAPATPCRRCTLLWSGITIRADGAIICCPNGGDKVLGHVGRDSIREVWMHSPLMVELREKVLVGRQDLPMKCKDCEYRWYCRQNCAALPPHPIGVCLKEIRECLCP